MTSCLTLALREGAVTFSEPLIFIPPVRCGATQEGWYGCPVTWGLCSQDALYPSVPHKGWGFLKGGDWAWWWFTTDSDGPAGSFQRWHDSQESQVPTFKWGQEGSWVYITDCTFPHFTKTGWSMLGTRVFLWIIQSNHLA